MNIDIRGNILAKCGIDASVEIAASGDNHAIGDMFKQVVIFTFRHRRNLRANDSIHASDVIHANILQ